MKISFTGAGGYIGQTFKRVYRKLDLTPLSYDLQKKEYFSLNKGNLQSIEQLLEPIEVLIHLGSFTPKNTQQSQDKISSTKNIKSTLRILNYGLPSLKHIVYISTIDVYDFTSRVSEKTAPNPRSEYATSKLVCEKLVQQFAEKRGILFSILRVGTVYGPGENNYQKVVPVMLREFIQHGQITIYDKGSARRNFIYVEDVARMIGEVALAPKQEKIINLTGLNPISIRDLASTIQLLLPKCKANILELKSISPSSDHDFDISILNSSFPNFEFTPILEGLYNELNFIKSRLS